MPNIIILSSLSIVAIVFLLVVRKRKSKSEITTFISTLIATLIGVLLAVTLSNWKEDTKEKEDTIKLLKSGQNSIASTLNYVETIGDYIHSVNEDNSVNEQSRDSIISELKSNNPLPYPKQFETILSYELVAKNLSEFSHFQIYNNLVTLESICRYDFIDVYILMLKELNLICDIEIEYQLGNTDLDKMAGIYEIEKSKFVEQHAYDNIQVLGDE